MILLLSLSKKSSLIAGDETLKSFLIVVKEEKKGFVLHFEIQIQVLEVYQILV